MEDSLSSEEDTLLSTPRIDSDSEGHIRSSRRKRVPPAISMIPDMSSEEENTLSSSKQQHQMPLFHRIPATTSQDAPKGPIQRLSKTKRPTVQRPPKLPKDPSKDTPRQAEEVINLCGDPNPIPNLFLALTLTLSRTPTRTRILDIGVVDSGVAGAVDIDTVGFGLVCLVVVLSCLVVVLSCGRLWLSCFYLMSFLVLSLPCLVV